MIKVSFKVIQMTIVFFHNNNNNTMKYESIRDKCIILIITYK